MLVFDLDPGAPATIIELCPGRAACPRHLWQTLELECWAKTSGSKGMQLYVPLNTPHTHEHASQFALAVAQLLEKQSPKAVTSTMKKSVRTNKIFVDWSQNSRHKTTIAPYSLRARPTRRPFQPPLTWDEVSDGADGQALSFVAGDVLVRVEEFGDLFAPNGNARTGAPETVLVSCRAWPMVPAITR